MIENKNICIINHYAYPLGYGFHTRQHVLAKMLSLKGFNVTIFTSSFNHLLNKDILFKGEYLVEEHDEIKYVWIKTPKYRGNGISRIKNIFHFSKKFDKIFDKINIKPDIVWASSPQPFVITNAVKLQKKYNCKFIFEERDIWPLTLTELSGISKFNPLIMYFDYLQKLAYRKSDLVLTPLDNLKEYINSKGFNKKTVKLISQPLSNINFLESSINIPADKFVVGYVGSIGESNSIFNLIKAAKELNLNKDIYFLIVGDGPQFNEISTFIKKENMKNVLLTGRVEKNEAMTLISKCDIVYKGNPNISLYKYGIASVKLVEYLALGIPVIHATNIKNDLVSKAKAGLLIESENLKELVNGIIKMSRSKELLKEYSENGIKYVKENYTNESISEELVDTFKDILEEK